MSYLMDGVSMCNAQWCDQDTCIKTKTSRLKTKTPNENHIIYMIGK